MGVEAQDVQSLPESLRSYLGLPDHGAMITGVQEGSPAEAASLKGAQFQMSAEGETWEVGGGLLTASPPEPSSRTSALASPP